MPASSAVTATIANAAATMPSPLPPLSLLLQPPPTSLHLRRSCRWLVVVSSVAPCLLHCPLSKFVSPPRHAVVNVDDDRYRRYQRLPLPLPQSTTATSKTQRLLFVVDGGNDNHRQLQWWSMVVAAMKPLPPPSTTATRWWPIFCCCHHRQCCRHHALALASTVTIAAAFANVIAHPTLLLMVGCCVVCCSSPAALSTVQICQPLLSCGSSLMLFPLGRRPLLLTIARCCLLLFY
jgi:hypothetical protein